MIKYIYLLIGFCIVNIGLSQSMDYLKGIAKSDTNFFQVKSSADLYFGQDSSLREGNKYGYKEFLRWSQFWEGRTFNELGNVGDLKKYYEVMSGYSQNRSTTCNNSLGLGYQWDFLGPQNLPDQYLGMITSVAFFDDGTTKTIFAGSAAGGIFVTTNMGANWTCITDDLNMPGIGFSDLRILDDPTNNKRYLIAGTGLLHRGYGVGILRLDLLNPSSGWVEETGLPLQSGGVLQKLVNQIILHPTDKSKVFALIGNSLYESLDYGDTWNQVFSGGSNHQFSKMIFHPADPNIQYISTYTTANPCVSPPVIWKSSDGGQSWSIMSASFNLPISARIDISTSTLLPNAGLISEDPLFCALSETIDCQNGFTLDNTEIYQYDNSTTEFTLYASKSGQDIYFTRHCFELSKFNFNSVGLPEMYFGSLGFHQIIQSTFNATYISDLNMHKDIRDMEIIPDFSNNQKDHILIGNDGGISLSTDNGVSWTNLNGPGLNITMFHGIDVAEANIDILMGGTQDNNAYKYDYLNNSWARFSDGDVYKFQISEKDGDQFYHSNFGFSYLAHKKKLSDPSYTGLIKLVPDNLTELSGPTSLPQYQHPSGVIYYGQKEVGVLTDPCYQAKFISNIYQSEGLNSTLNAIGVCEYHPEVIYIGYGGVEQGNNGNPKKFYKCINATSDTPVWDDITDHLNNSFDTNPNDNYTIFDWIEISDIVVNPTNEQELWVSFRNISYDFQGNGTLRVIHSTDGGDTWLEWSTNLPVVPVNDIEYYNGSNGGIYAATDVGIYYTDNSNYSTNGWTCINENLPVLLVNDIEINYTRKKIVAGTFGRGIYESDLHIFYPYAANTTNPFNCNSGITTISSDMTIPGDKTYCGDVEIKAGVTLTVTGNIFMAPGKEIIIKNSTVTGTPGGRLVLNGGTITTKESCEESGRWKGIFVMGDPTKSQAPYFNTQQAMLTVTNGGTISNAEVGAHAGKLNGFTIQNQGGIIITDDANFLNNKKDIVLWPYTNYLNTTANPIANRSRFTKTKFQTITANATNNLLETDNTQHLVLFGVDGILIRECLFENKRNPTSNGNYDDPTATPQEMALQEMGIGIYSVNSRFRVTGYCDFYTQQSPNQCAYENEFKNLFYGIKAVSSNPLKSAFIDGNYFNGNYHGIFLNGIDYAYVATNLFSVRNVPATVSLNTPTPATPGTDIPYGLHLNQCNNYKITENYFNSVNPPTFGSGCNNDNIKVSLQISLPDGNPEEIYNNYFTDYHSNKDLDPGVAVLVQGDPNDTDPNNLSGLQILCNDFNGAKVGNAERFANHIALTVNGKVNENQGSATNAQSPAGNRFGLSFVGSSSIHKACEISDEPLDNCAYFTNDDGEFNTTDGLLPSTGISYYHHSNTLAHPLDVQCGSLDVINNPTPFTYQKSVTCPTIINPNPQPLLFRQAISTYITSIEKELKFIDAGNTQELLNLIYGTASAGQVKNALMDASPYLSDDVLEAYLNDNPPHGHLKEVVIANSPVTKEIKQIIDSKNLPNGIRNQINAAQTGTSERQNLEARVDWFELKKEQNINELVRYHLYRDTLPDYLDSMKQVFSRYNEHHSACKLASAFATQKDYIQALSILNAHLAEHPDDALCKLQKLMIEFDQLQSWCLNPTQEQKDQLEAIKNEPHKGCIAAKGILELIEELPLKDYRVLPRTTRSASIEEERTVEETKEVLIAYPNPTSEFINFNCDAISDEFTFIDIYDFTGKIIQTIQPDKSGFAYSDMSAFSNGIYLAVLKSSGLTRGQTKFILNK